MHSDSAHFRSPDKIETAKQVSLLLASDLAKNPHFHLDTLRVRQARIRGYYSAIKRGVVGNSAWGRSMLATQGGLQRQLLKRIANGCA